MLRPVSISHYLAVMRARGYAEAALCVGTGIDASALADPEYLISHEDHQTLISNMIRLSGDHGLALDLVEASEIPHFSVLAYAGQSCHTIREGLQEVWSRYGQVFGVFADMHVVDLDAERSAIEIRVPRTSEPLYRFGVEEALAVLLKLGGALAPEPVSFLAVALAYARPAYADRYTALFKCPCTFEAAQTVLTVRRSWLDKSFKTTDAELHRACRVYLDRVLNQTALASPLTQRLRQHLLQNVRAMPTLNDVAREFGMSARTLARHLRQQGHTYRSLTEDIRIELARKWLDAGAYSAKEISYRLGFSDVAAFRRAFKGWTGQTLSQYGGQSTEG